MVNIVQDSWYQKVINWWDIYFAKSKVISLLWILSETSESIENYNWDILTLRDWYSLDPQDKTLPILLNLSLSLVALWPIWKFIIEVSKLDQTWKMLVLDSSDLKNDEIINELGNLINAQYVISIKFRYLLDFNTTAKLIEDSYNKWLINDLNVVDVTIWKSEWQIAEMGKYLTSQKEIYWDMSFILNIDDLDKRIDGLMCLYHFEKEGLIRLEWSEIDYKASTLLGPSLFKITIKGLTPVNVWHLFEFDTERDQLKYNGVYMWFGKKNLDFIRTFFDLLEDGQEYIQVDEILLWIERGYADVTGKDRYEAKRKYIYYPRETVNKSIEKQTGLKDFFVLGTENIRLSYPQYVRLSKKS